MGDRRNKKIRAYRSSQSHSTEDSSELRDNIEPGSDMGRPKHTVACTGSSRDSSSRDQKRKRPSRERWLLTRKTWRYMADAGRRLIPEGAQNRPEDVPKIEAYFQEVCHREPKFLLWRKSSYPGALGFRSHHRKNRRKMGGSCREKTNSADEADTSHVSASVRALDLQRLKNEFLHGPSQSGCGATHRQKQNLGCEGPLPGVPETTVTSPDNEDEENERELMETLSKYLNLQDKSVDTLSTGDEMVDIDYQRLVDQLRKYLSASNILEDHSDTMTTTEDRTTDRVRTTTQRPLSPISRLSFEAETQERMTLDTFRRYYSKSTCRQKVITDLLTDRKLLEKLYFGLRQTRSFKARSVGMMHDGSGFSPRWTSNTPTTFVLRCRREGEEVHKGDGHNFEDSTGTVSWTRFGKSLSKDPRGISFSPPPLIEIEDKYESGTVNRGTQTEPIPATVLVAIEDELKKSRSNAAQEGKEDGNVGGTGRRRSSVDNDDVSPSVSDTIKRYLRMARKKSLDADKVDRFKRVNYDRNLRNIKPKGEITMPGDDDGLHKGCQPDESWIAALKELKLEDISSDPEMSPGGDDFSGSRMTSSRSSLEGAGVSDDAFLSPLPVNMSGKPSPHHSHSSILSTGQNFLSNLLHGLQHHQQQHQGNEEISGMTQISASTAIPVGGAMQKSKSSSSVVHHGSRVAKKIWRARSKSQSRATSSTTSSWTPQGNCTWTNVTGRQVTLTDTSLLTLCEVERRMLQKVAVAKLQALNLGVAVRIPSEAVVSVSHKPKRRPYLLKRKALTTGFFDSTRGKDDKDKDNGGMVFGIPISQCLENDRLSRIQHGCSPGRDDPSELRRKSHHGSRSSFSSLIETTTTRGDESGSCESLMSPGDRMAGSVPGLLDALSCGSTADISSGDREPSIPHIVQACCHHLENFGLHTLGIFRVSSSKKRVRQLREEFDSGKEINLGEDHCPHDVATLLKEFFRDLPEPLLCRDLYQAFVQTQKIRNRRLQFEALQHLIQLLPVPNRDTLWALLNFLVTVARNAGDYKDETGEWLSGSKMDSNNLATVFAPNILHCIKPGSNKELSTERAEERIDVINVIRSMIDHNKELFQIPAELLDEVYIHMMDSHPEALDQLLSRRGNLGDELVDDLESTVAEVACSDSSSLPRIGSEHQTLQLAATFSEGEDQLKTVRRVWSREEFLHETAGMGGPDMSMRPRHKDRDRGRERSSKKRWREDSSKKMVEPDGDVDLPKSGYSITTSTSASQISLSGYQKSSILSEQRIETAAKMRSASVNDGSAVTHPSEHGNILERGYDDEIIDENSRRQSPLQISDSGSGGGGIITASLKIPVPSGASGTSFALNLDDADIPYIEDGGGGGGGGGGFSIASDGGRQLMTIGLVHSTGEGNYNAPRCRRQRSASGSDSSQASTSVHQPGNLSALYHQQQGCDSALGSSAAFSSPPHNTTPSICSSDAGHFSSPPSWASSPPTSPDAVSTTINFIPEELSAGIQQHHSQTARISIGTSSKSISTQMASVAQAGSQQMFKEVTPMILQTVTFTSTSELQQVQRSDTANDRPDIQSSKLAIRKVHIKKGELPKSASTSAVASSFKKSVEFESEPADSDRKPATSISSIGGAVMRSKTADIERMLRIKGTEASKFKTTTIQQPQQVPVQDDKKKYSKRRYTDSRHQTRHIPDSEALREDSSAGVGGTGGSDEDAAVIRQRKSKQGPVWKRRELIASDPKDHESRL